MPLERFVLILFVVLAAAGLTVFVATFMAAAWGMPTAQMTAAIPVLLAGYVLWRVIANRMIDRARRDHADR